MSFRIGTNVNSLTALRHLDQTGRALTRSFERLATGRRINFARDDASGMAVSEGLRSQRQSLQRSMQGLNESRAFLGAMEASIVEQTEIVQRMRELALNAANGTMSNQERNLLNTEVVQLYEEFQRIAAQSQFNGTSLLSEDTEFSVFVGTRTGQEIETDLESTKSSDVFRREVGSGVYNEVSSSSIASAAWELIVEDLNGDGFDDQVLALLNTDQVLVKLGDGAGNFETVQTISINASAGDIEVADFDGDGDADIIVSGVLASGVELWENNGSGSFTLFSTLATEGTQLNVIVTDLDGDGIQDIVGQRSAGAQARFEVYFGEGDGSFSALQTYSAPLAGLFATRTMKAADVDGDGRVEILGIQNSVSPAAVTIRKWNGSGFTALGPVNPNTGTSVSAFDIGDINGDGNLDIVIGSSLGVVGVALNGGTGTSWTSSTFYVGASGTISEIDLSDYDDDGRLDILGVLPGSWFVGRQRATGDFSMSLNSSEVSVGRVSFGDFNNDGFKDVFLANATLNRVYEGASTDLHRASEISVSTQESAQRFLGILDFALDELTSRRSKIGALQNRLDSAFQNGSVWVENLSAAESQVRDLDYAIETAELTRHQILQQSQVAVSQQANTKMLAVLQLLRS